ncbi:MAG TPA: 5-methyltetrahydropteroyltriglutamate--homocysteine S-methyltransferase [Bryobacteraceae bacterium]|nr:5-methyltetrahydropteroyltriglutamate--homocysteine S-methyltransferase [Bryobacteraceae bacterium]
MVETKTAPFRADHVGSLLRPPELLKARDDYQHGRMSAAQLRRAEDTAIREVVRRQEDLGLQSITDGEFRRNSWHLDFISQIGGLRQSDELMTIHFINEQGAVEYRQPVPRVENKLQLEHCIFGEDFQFLRSIARATPKLTIPSPSVLLYSTPVTAVNSGVYPDVGAFHADVARLYAKEVDALGKVGCTYLQLDDVILAILNDPSRRATLTSLGLDGEHAHLAFIRVFNEALAHKPAGMTVCTHLCRGNFRSAWSASGGYDHVAEALFGELNVDGYFLEYDDARSGTFAPLRFLPRGRKKVVLGIVTSKRAALESKDALKRRVDEAAKYVPLEQICLSPQCGFSSTVEGNVLTIDEQFAKLRLVVETAREIWEDA